MGTLLCYEGWDGRACSDELVPHLIEFALRIFPTLNNAYISISGRGTVIRCPVGQIVEKTKKVHLSWSVSMLDSQTQLKGAPFATSDPFCTILMHDNFRGLYLFGENVEPLIGCGELSSLLEILGSGFGYCTEFAGAVEATLYALDLRATNSDISLSNVLRRAPTRRWSEIIRSSEPEDIARDLYMLNIWPNHFIRALSEDTSARNFINSGSAKMVAISSGMTVLYLPNTSILIGRGCLKKFLLEAQIPPHLN